MPVARLNGTDLFYVEVGEGLPCLVMHGGLGIGDHSVLHPWLDPLGDVMRLIYYDHRGNGRSGRPPSETITFEQLCSDADALRDYLGFEEVAVLGYSFGGSSRSSTLCATPSTSATSSCSAPLPAVTMGRRSRPTPGARVLPKSN